MEEIYKKSTICFVNESEYEKFKESCLQRSKDFCGWDIRNEYDLITFNEECQKEHGFKFKVTFDMFRVC